ncbi:hypothetical protein [Roseisalinus antarcticus]|uniref:Uncharacterized protein n=1 Tax=Roseisalinus antarcticus TaxID=254357 RepID=A0A1Y5SSP3_9RHOB|nr:hypothetical protein [Roseisalinus antarcticus]SLN46099.1 hypothetical protein ROA7023_01891 [Roseisalinus antarcticus]
MARHEPWARPEFSAIPNRPGDREAEPLYAALGHAVSDWEGVNAVTAALHRALLLDDDRDSFESAEIEAFGGLNNVHRRAKELSDLSKGFFGAAFGDQQDEANEICKEIASLLAAYRGWAERRNDLAHGYVTRADGPDYYQEDQPIVATYALCPSHARIPKWPFGEPDYNYVAEDISSFAAAFRALDIEIEAMANRIENLRPYRLGT